jgi:hypothetical protein
LQTATIWLLSRNVSALTKDEGPSIEKAEGHAAGAYAVDARGEKTAISARSFVVQVGRGLELKVDLTPEGPWAHHVHIQTFDGALALLLGAANVVHVSVEGSPG